VYYYNLSMSLDEGDRSISAMINEANNIRIEIADFSAVDDELTPENEALTDVMEANLTKAEATSLMYHLQQLISLLPVVK